MSGRVVSDMQTQVESLYIQHNADANVVNTCSTYNLTILVPRASRLTARQPRSLENEDVI